MPGSHAEKTVIEVPVSEDTITRATHYLSLKLRRESFPEKGGYGIVATAPVRRGELLCVWGGRIVAREEVDRLDELERSYVLQVEEELYLLAGGPIEHAEYVNHSCEPNAGFAGQISLVAMRNIQPGEEVCFDYGMSESSDFAEFDCRCGAPACRGRVRADDWLRHDLQRRYRGFFSPYLQRRIEALPEPMTVTRVRSAGARVSRRRPVLVAAPATAP
jgi:hypothetical protein